MASQRPLHTAFWNHGAADLELSRMWNVLVGSSVDSLDILSPPPSKPESLTASAFLLDFLYPSGAAALIKKLSPRIQHERPRVPMRNAIPSLHRTAATSLSALSSHDDARLSSPFMPVRSDTRPIEQHYADRRDNRSDEHTYSAPPDHSVREPEQDLLDLLASDGVTSFEAAWSLFGRLREEAKERTRPRIIEYLARSTAITEAWRISELFSQLREDQREDAQVTAAIKAELALQNIPHAISIFNSSLVRNKSAAGLDSLVAATLSASSWDILRDLWGRYKAAPASDNLDKESFREVSSVPQLMSKVHRLLNTPGETQQWEGSRSGDVLYSLVPVILQNCLASLEPSGVLSLLSRLQDPLLYEAFIPYCVENGDKDLAAQAYEQYRQIPNVTIKVSVLRSVIDITGRGNASRMEQILKDWYSRYDHLNRSGYAKFLGFYASRGDIASVQRMWKEFLTAHPTAIREDVSYFTHLINVYGRRHDIDGARQAFESIEGRYQMKPNVACWNSLLRACVNAGEYEQAFAVFSELVDAVQPNHGSFATIMTASGSRGDLPFTLDLYRMAKASNTRMTTSMLASVVEAYCQNDRSREAEHICYLATRDKTVEGASTELWNILLEHHAGRRDLISVNRILTRMTKLEVTYNDKTYDNLLLGLVYCRQAHHVLRLLRAAVRENIFQPTANHYLLLMFAFLQTGEAHLALRTDAMMTEMGLPRTSQRLLMVMQALRRWEHLAERQKQEFSQPNSIIDVVEEFSRSLQQENSGLSSTPTSRADKLGLMSVMLTEMKDFISTREILNLHKRNAPSQEVDSTSLTLLSAIMLADFHDGQFARVKDSWDIVFARALNMGRPAGFHEGEQEPSIVAHHQYDLVGPLKTMQMMYEAQNDGQGLIDLVSQVTSEGFELDSKSWNQYVQTLAGLKEYEAAFSACEQVLMPQWQGWYRDRVKQNIKNQIPLHIRRLGTSRKHLRPTSHTLLALARAYIDLQQSSPWSRDAERRFRQISNDCPRVKKAIRTLKRSGAQLEADVLDDVEPASSPQRGSGARDSLSEGEEGGSVRCGQSRRDVPPADKRKSACQEWMEEVRAIQSAEPS